MGRFSNCCPHGFPGFRAKWTPHQDLQMQALPKPKEADDTDGVPYIDKEKEPDILIIREIDPCVNINGPFHHTSRYDLMTREFQPQLVVRRGQSFQLDIKLSRPYNEEKDGISFIFTVDDEEKSSHGSGTMIAVPLLKKADRHLPWNVTIDKINENVLTVQVASAPDAVVAKWRMDVDTKIINDGAYSYSWETRIYILYNPWCKHDQVYLKSEEWRDEAVLNDVGLIWRGTYNRLKPVIWKYDQFEKDILDCALYLMHVVGKVKSSNRSDPVKTARALAAAVNAADDLGAVMGNWSTDHSGGTAPIKWIGSMEILQKYYKKKKPVKYGQCWVFSGVLTTISRALGIPARTITNYSSAHDTQNSLTVDYFMDENGSVMEELNSDSIWNFHVWNEVWMQRPDLGSHYGGWQAIDATPQELSEDMYRCGPSSVAAVKLAEILRPYDSNFLFAEVNADKIFWRYSGPTQPLKLLRKDIYGIGKLICTKAPSRFELEDITYTYKHPEKTNEERSTMLKALQQSESLFSRYYLNEDFNDVHFNFKLMDDVKIGQPFSVILEMKNRSSAKEYKVTVILRVEVVTYTGKVGDNVKKETFTVSIKPEAVEEAKLLVTYEEYGKRLIDQCAFNVACLATIEATKFEYYAQDDFRIRKPDIKIVLREKPVEDKEVTADISVENPLPVPLKKGEFTVQGPGIDGSIKVKVKNAVPPGERAKGEFKFTPPRTGRHTIAAKFVSKQMDDVDGYLTIMVEPKKEQNGQ
ncbi:annulin [Anoplophora glabripennis]|nr:annulin [Anoplophora glabripennis]XP_018576105.1 annulin [Anoplophora glabripennis]